MLILHKARTDVARSPTPGLGLLFAYQRRPSAVGIMLDGCTLKNGPMVLSRSHSPRYPGDGPVPRLATGRTGSVNQVHRRERHFTQR
jgi:hypothetical protein